MPLVPSYWSFTSKFTFQFKKGWQICKAAYLLLVLPHWDSSGISLPIGFPVWPERVTQLNTESQPPGQQCSRAVGAETNWAKELYGITVCLCVSAGSVPSHGAALICTLAFPTKLSPLSSSEEEVGMRGHVTGFSGVSFWVGSAS